MRPSGDRSAAGNVAAQMVLTAVEPAARDPVVLSFEIAVLLIAVFAGGLCHAGRGAAAAILHNGLQAAGTFVVTAVYAAASDDKRILVAAGDKGTRRASPP